MVEIKDAVTTYAGIELISEALFEQGSIQFTRVAAGNGVYDGTENLRALTDLKSAVKEMSIENIERIDQTAVKIVATLLSDDAEGFGLTEIGVFAKIADETEALHSIIVMEKEDHVPPYSAQYRIATTFSIYCVVNSETEVQIGDYSGQYITRSEALKQIKALQEKIKTIGKVRFGPEDTEINPEDTLFIADGMASALRAAAYSNMVFSNDSPEGTKAYWAETDTASITEGKLSVSEEASTDADFFAQITS